MTKTAIAILNFNGVSFLETFLPTFLKNSADAEIIIIDNASTDNSTAWLRENYPEVRCIELNENHGFAGGYNVGLKEIDAEYYAIVNSDIEVTPDWISPLIEFMDNHPHYGACQPKILSQTEKHLFEYAGASGGFIDQLGYPFCRGRIFDIVEQDEGQYDDITDIFWTSGACMIIRKELFFDVGGFDSDFFAHMEEIDLCWRLHSRGFKLAVIPQSVVYHVGGGTLAKTNPRKTYLNFRNGLSLLMKNLPFWQLWKIPVRLFLDLIAALKFWKDNDIGHLNAVLKAHIHFIFHLPKTINKRKKAVAIPSELIKSKWVVKDYFLKNRKKFSDLS